MKPTIGRIVLVRILDKYNTLINIPAIIVKVWDDTMLNVVAFHDGSNDLGNNMADGHTKWLTSVKYDANLESSLAMTWYWPPRV